LISGSAKSFASIERCRHDPVMRRSARLSSEGCKMISVMPGERARTSY